MKYPTVRYNYQVISEHGVDRVIWDRSCDYDDAISDGWISFPYRWKHIRTELSGWERVLCRSENDFDILLNGWNQEDPENWVYSK